MEEEQEEEEQAEREEEEKGNIKGVTRECIKEDQVKGEKEKTVKT